LYVTVEPSSQRHQVVPGRRQRMALGSVAAFMAMQVRVGWSSISTPYSAALSVSALELEVFGGVFGAAAARAREPGEEESAEQGLGVWHASTLAVVAGGVIIAHADGCYRRGLAWRRRHTYRRREDYAPQRQSGVFVTAR
jgi:hypothetical protein